MIGLMRRYAYGFVNSHDFDVPVTIMSEDYTLHVGTETLIGRDDHYLPAVQRQMDQFPQLGYSIHELITDGMSTAVLFSEHGQSARHAGHSASWIGMGIYRAEQGVLRECWVEQDHYGKRQQLTHGVADSVPEVAVDPWSGHEDAAPTASAAAEPIVRAWLASLESWPPADALLDEGAHHGAQPRLRVTDTTLHAVVAEGDRIAFNARIAGTYEGGLENGPRASGQLVETWVGAIGHLKKGEVTAVRGATNRVAVQRQLRTAEQE